MRAWVEIDLGALLRNARAVGGRAGVPILPMVKADAYGLGAGPVVQALETVHPWGYGVATVEEGAALRAGGITRTVVVFDPILAEEIEAAHAERLSPTLGDVAMITRWATATGNAPWHLAIDTGMSRTGVRWTTVGDLHALLAQYPPIGACTHFHSADADDGSADIQLGRFRSAVGTLAHRPPVLHAENSPAIERLTEASTWTLVRPGVFLYGVGSRGIVPPTSPAPQGRPLESEPVVALRARIVELRWIEPGESVSYGATFRATERRRIATVAAGYADGYRRAFSNVGRALVRGQRVPVAGVVTMDMTMLDVTGVDCAVGDVTTLLGIGAAGSETGAAANTHQPRDAIDVNAAARDAGLCSYELLTGLRLRLPRVYLDAPRA